MKFKIRDVSRKVILRLLASGEFGCGAGKLMSKWLPDFTFKWSCVRHDLGYRRGGGVKDEGDLRDF